MRGDVKLRLSQAAGFAVGLTVVGLLSIYTTVMVLWGLWLLDPLKSIGALVPIVSLLFILRAWRSLGWEMDGTWWGLALLAFTVALVHLRDHTILEFVIGPSWSIFLPPHSLVALMYTTGAVLLFGGWRLLRAARFPVLLTWLVNPVPNFFTLHVDLPLQHLSSGIARGFAHAMGQPLTADQLKLMFTPDFGMFIAPGCNGIRGAVTMGFIALVAGYLYKFKPRVTALLVVGAVLLGYVFNLVRLCALVLFYITALHIPWLQSKAEMGDYVIGACLFFVATGLLFSLIQRWSPTGSLMPPKLERVEGEVRGEGDAGRDFEGRDFEGWGFAARWAGFALLVVLGSATYVRAMTNMRVKNSLETGESDRPPFPERVGAYKLQRVWMERLPTGALVFYWADYAPPNAVVQAADHTPDGGDARDGDSGVVSVGISPTLGAHDTLLCHAARGEDWLWHGELELGTETGETSLSGSFFNTGATQYLEATTVCSGGTCGQYTTNARHFGFVYSRPDTRTVLSESPTRPIPVLLRTETLNTSMASDRARAELTDNLRNFLSGANLAEFTKPYREP
jgi:exosortase J